MSGASELWHYAARRRPDIRIGTEIGIHADLQIEDRYMDFVYFRHILNSLHCKLHNMEYSMDRKFSSVSPI